MPPRPRPRPRPRTAEARSFGRTDIGGELLSPSSAHSPFGADISTNPQSEHQSVCKAYFSGRLCFEINASKCLKLGIC